MIKTRISVYHEAFDLYFSKTIDIPFALVPGMEVFPAPSSAWSQLRVVSSAWYHDMQELFVDTEWSGLSEQLNGNKEKLQTFMEKDGWEVG